jgi:ABC-2 type transport system ATP-binding protein
MIAFNHLTKKFGSFTAVDNLSFEVSPEQSIALWGPNGAGKTTVIKCLLGLLRYDGQIHIDGLDAQRDGRKARRLLGYVPQELSFYGDMRTLETAQFFAALKRLPMEQATSALEQVGLEDHADKPVDALSGGMKQRLALGLALLGDPPLLILDEPTSSLDKGGRGQFLALLSQVKAAGKTLLFTSHRLEEIELLADQVVVMEAGAMRETCAAADLAGHLGLHTQVKLRLPLEQIDDAMVVLQADGFDVQQNGVGLVVDVEPTRKAEPIHALSRAQITVTDFEIE